MALTPRRQILVSIIVVAGLLAGALFALAAQSGSSVRGWLVGHVVLPALGMGRHDGPDDLQKRIRENRAAGPALPPQKLRDRFEFSDETTPAGRVLVLKPHGGAKICILYLHGGAYVSDLIAPHWDVIGGLADRTHAEIRALLYPLAPEHHWPDGIAAAQLEYDAVVSHFGADKVIVAGDSAGGGLALLLAQSLASTDRPMPAGLVLFSPWLDVSMSGPDQPEIAKRDPMLKIDGLRIAAKLWADGLPLNDPRISPLFGDLTHLPATLLFVGTDDILLSDAHRLMRTGAKVTLREYPGMFHVWVGAPIPEAKRALDEAAAFIDSQTHRFH
jgi:monoterpene epsilon-lactone hydrolase